MLNTLLSEWNFLNEHHLELISTHRYRAASNVLVKKYPEEASRLEMITYENLSLDLEFGALDQLIHVVSCNDPQSHMGVFFHKASFVFRDGKNPRVCSKPVYSHLCPIYLWEG